MPRLIIEQLGLLLRRHIESLNQTSGRLFLTPYGAAIKESTYTDVWRAARERALLPQEASSNLVRRPYELRHSCVSTWLAAGVDSAQIAQWVGHSVAVLHRVYAHVLPGREAVAQQRIEVILRGD